MSSPCNADCTISHRKMRAKPIDDCFRRDLNDKLPLSHDQVIRQLRTRIQPAAGTASFGLTDAGGRICAEDIIATCAVPRHNNSAVDGYAFALESLKPDSPAELHIAARAVAGRPAECAIRQGEAARIFTGAVLPEGCDTVAMQEDCALCSSKYPEIYDAVRVPIGLRQGANIRKAGEDVCEGDILLKAGDIIRAQDIAGLASIGLSSVTCFAPVRIAIISSGDEIVRGGAASSARGQVYDANAPMLLGLAAAMGASVTDLGVLPDCPDTVKKALQDAARNFDLILTSGGASEGEEDHMAGAIEALGMRHFWHISVKPGRPLMFGQIGSTLIVGLPGNPVAAFVCFLMYAHPMIRRLGGAAWPEPRRFTLPAAFDVTQRKTGRREFWRGITREEGGVRVVDKFARDGSGLISSLRAADGLIDVPENLVSVRRGDRVRFIPFSEFAIGV